MRRKGITTIKTKDGLTVQVTDREGFSPTTVEFTEDGDVRLDGKEPSYDVREIAAINEFVQANAAKRKR